MNAIDINTLSPEQKKSLENQLKADKREAKAKRANDLTAFKDLSESYIEKHIDSLVHHHEITGMMIEKLWNDFKPLRDLKAGVYGVKINDQDSYTVSSKDGSSSITVGYNVTIGFDGTESAGVEKIKEFLKSLSSDADNVKKLSAAVNTFLKPNVKTGMLNPSKIIELSKLKSEFNDDRFDEGLEIIMSAQQRRQNSMYVSGWKFVIIDGLSKKLEFRFTI
ncbi:DUF3164 family protein [Chryseobacterium herbae]|uniref:DUF3164 family protein n=1 Tax=Chryseobacterium herbae TaxID=2976476 RepID=A0ABT2IYP2_9FLAO|nr:DUF3164 family protein [Chryseobacterium sp. pc1-10]MCT2563973.1 DUF3164 family protein [Chryseobacterium sp. pc1-10]